MENKNFKVGDIVTCIRDGLYVVTTKGVKCEVIAIDDCDNPSSMTIKVIDKDNQWCGHWFGVYSKYFEKVNNTVQPFTALVNGVYCKCVPVEDKEELINLWANDIHSKLNRYCPRVITEGRNTIVILSDDNWDTVKVGVARCADTDKYVSRIGTAVAAAKAMGEKIPACLYDE